MAIKLVHHDITLGVMSVPYRVQKALYIQRGNHVEPVAWFRHERDAKEVERILDLLVYYSIK